MNWFGRKSATAPAALPAWSALSGSGEVDVSPRSYQARLSEVFLKNPVGQRSVRLVAGTVAALPIDQTNGKTQAGALALRPKLLETIAAHLLLHGNADLYCVEGDLIGTRVRLQGRERRITGLSVCRFSTPV